MKLARLAEGRHDPWPYINYLLSLLKMAYREFAERVGEVKVPRGFKTDLVLAAINRHGCRPAARWKKKG